MIFFLHGADHYRLREKLAELKTGFIQKRDKAGLNLITLEGENLDFDQFRQEVMTVPFLSEKKMIVVKNLLAGQVAANRGSGGSRGSSRGGRSASRSKTNSTKANTKKLNNKNYAANKNAGNRDPAIGGVNKTDSLIADFLLKEKDRLENILCFVEFFPDFNAQKTALAGPLAKLLVKEKFAWQFNPLDGRELANWLNQFCAAQNISIEPAALTTLIINVGRDLTDLTIELKKLQAYKNHEIITSADVKFLVKAKFDDNIFNLTDAISQKNQLLALKLLTEQLRAGSPPLMILSLLNRQFKILWQIKTGAKSAGEIKVHPFVFQKANQQSRGFTLEKLQDILNNLIKMESEFKTGGESAKNPELMFDLLIAKSRE